MSFLNTGQCEIITTEPTRTQKCSWSPVGQSAQGLFVHCKNCSVPLLCLPRDTYTYAGGDHRQKPNMYFITIGLGLTNGYAQIILPMPLPMKARL